MHLSQLCSFTVSCSSTHTAELLNIDIKHLCLISFTDFFPQHLFWMSPKHDTNEISNQEWMTEWLPSSGHHRDQIPVFVCIDVEWKTGILTEEKTMEMLDEWWRWICHSLCHAMTMTYKIQDTALSHALHCHLCNNFPTTGARLQGTCAQSNFNRSLVSDTT